MKNLLMLFAEQIIEAIYFSLFLIVGKNIKTKRFLFIGIMIFEYLMLKQFIHFSVYFHLTYTFMTYVNLKVLYKEKAQITDLFLFAEASLILIITSILCYAIIYFTIHEYVWVLIINRPLIFAIIYFGRNIIRNTYKKFCSLWNRHSIPHKIKSLTLRNISIVVFNLMFWFINLCMIFFLRYLR